MNVASQAESLESVRHGVKRLRGDPTVPPHASIVVPVNAQADLENVLDIVGDVSRYEGSRTFEVVLVINNYPADAPPRELGDICRCRHADGRHSGRLAKGRGRELHGPDPRRPCCGLTVPRPVRRRLPSAQPDSRCSTGT